MAAPNPEHFKRTLNRVIVSSVVPANTVGIYIHEYLLLLCNEYPADD